MKDWSNTKKTGTTADAQTLFLFTDLLRFHQDEKKNLCLTYFSPNVEPVQCHITVWWNCNRINVSVWSTKMLLWLSLIICNLFLIFRCTSHVCVAMDHSEISVWEHRVSTRGMKDDSTQKLLVTDGYSNCRG